MNALDPSRRAADADGPNTLMDAAASESANPSTSGASGPTTTRSILWVLQKSSTSACLPTSKEGKVVMPGSAAIPGLPGVQYRALHNGLWDSFHARACSRPPPPTTKTLTELPLLLLALTIVRRGDCLHDRRVRWVRRLWSNGREWWVNSIVVNDQ